MYERFYGLREKPFNLTPDPEFLYLSRRHKEALDQITYGVTRREGFALIIGDVGTGKTTLCWSLLGRLEGNVHTALVLNPMLSEEDLLRTILQDFGVRGTDDAAGSEEATPAHLAPYDPGWMHGLSKKELLDELNNFLLKRAQEDVFCVLILDEAQNLSTGCLEQLRMLSNLETAKKKLIQIIFVGQLEFGMKLKSTVMKALNQRISVRSRIGPLSRKETRDYIYHRLRVAKAPRDLTFSRSALWGIYRHSQGYPRLINLICDRALLAGFSERSYKINRHMIRKSVQVLKKHAELRLSPYLIPRVVVPAAAVALVVMLAVFFPAVSRWINPLGVREPASQVRRPAAPQVADARIPPAPARQVNAELKPDLPAPAPAPVTTQPAPKSPPPATASRVRTEASGSYSIQVHSFKSRQQADVTVSNMQQDGFEAHIRPNGAWFVIFVGPYADLESAKEKAGELTRMYGASPIIRRSAANQDAELGPP